MLLLRLTTTTCATSLSRAFSSGFACTSAESHNLLEKVRLLCTQVHALALKTSFDACVYVANALITMYSKSSSYDVDKDEAWRVFKDTEFRTRITWNAMIACFQLRGQWTQAIQLFFTMQRNGFGFDRATLLSVISSLCGASGNGADSGLSWCLQFHGLTIKTGFVSQIKVASALIKAYSILGGAVSDCYDLFMETSGYRDLVSWTGIISTVAEREPEEALFLFCRLRQEGLTPDRFTFSIVLKACAGLAKLVVDEFPRTSHIATV
ncbi:hypothetical protein RJ639_012774 [Escallonia herrerae]|uniref:Pentatricopeptide repeat-containing protein n=1 Tax=Escallonia herrerae TaxID=1293975 RepID=A0AA88VQU5_9ASTE|nr:hypothetical protein RJ639_012774 [Escallonia herrerae]